VANFGFNDDAAKRGYISAAQESDLVARAGASVERIPLAWGWIEPDRGRFDWSVYDRLYEAYRARGIRPLWAVQSPPGWASDGSCPASMPNCVLPPAPAYDADWRDFVEDLVRRYPESSAIEVWNEPNSALFWGGAPNPGRYLEVLRAAYAGVRAASPTMPVVLGGLADVQGERGTPAASFLRTLYTGGARTTMDAVAYHPYPAGPDPVPALRSLVGRVRAVRDAAGDQTKPLWITETGAATAGEQSYPAFDDASQARALVAIYYALAAMPDVHAVVLHRLIDESAGQSLESGFGALRHDLSPKPAYCAIARERGSSAGC
jgi:hypothetical protein